MSSADAPRRWDRSATIALVALLVVLLASLFWLVHPWYEAGDETNDASIYIACAKSMLAGEGYAYLGEPFTVRPPGFSALLALLIAWRGVQFPLLNLFVSLFGVALVACLFAFARARVGTLVALAIAFAAWFNDGFRTLCCQVMSDVPGAALLLAYLLVERWAARRPSWKRGLLLGSVVSVFAHVRSILVLLGPATLLARLFTKLSSGERGGWWTFVLTRIAPLALSLILIQLPWNLRNAAHHPEPPVDQNYLYSYSAAMWHVDGGDPGSPRRSVAEVAARVPGHTLSLLDALGRRMCPRPRAEATAADGEPGSFGALDAAIGAVLLACVAAIAFRRREAPEIFALANVAVLCTYFGFRDRLVLPIWILALPAAAECALLLARRALAGRAELAIAALFLALPILDFRLRAGWDKIERNHQATAELCAALSAKLAPGERVAAPIGWHYSVYLDRPVWSLFFAARREGGLQGAEHVIAKYGIGAVVLSPMFPADRAMIPWFREHHGPGEAAGAGFVFRVGR
jgi:hypothetical protein